ncbi:MAG: hypothetical protein FD118_4113, partial [Rhodocyclaceae bacterium]
MMFPANKKRPAAVKATSSPVRLLQKLAPPQTIIHIGAGTGNGEMHQWQQWAVPHAVIIDTDPVRLEWTKPLIAENPGWHILSAVLADAEGETDYYRATNPEEDGLIPAERLSALWPNLHTIDRTVRPTRRLDHLLAETNDLALDQAAPIWTFVDCLPALPILKGAGEQVERWSVLWLRVLLQPIAEIDEGAALASIEEFLQPHGFRCVDVTESNHPALGYALFVRNWQAVLQPRIEALAQTNAVLVEEKAALTQQDDARQGEVAALTAARDEEARKHTEASAWGGQLKQERDAQAAQIETLTQAKAGLEEEKSALAQRRDALQAEVAALAAARDEAAKKHAEASAWGGQLKQERDAQANLAA